MREGVFVEWGVMCAVYLPLLHVQGRGCCTENVEVLGEGEGGLEGEEEGGEEEYF